MRGYGTVVAYSGYSRNSGCGGVCGRAQSKNTEGDITAGTFRWDNGPQGFGDHCKPGTTTQWPSTLNMGSTFDPELALEWGDAMGDEFWCAPLQLSHARALFSLCLPSRLTSRAVFSLQAQGH